MLVEFTISPLGIGESVSCEVAEVVKVLEASNLPNTTHPMGSIIEGSWDEVMEVIKKCHHTLSDKGLRTITSIKIDDRPSKPMDRLTAKLESLKEKMDKSNK